MTAALRVDLVDVFLMNRTDPRQFGVSRALGRQPRSKSLEAGANFVDLPNLLRGVFADNPSSLVRDDQSVTGQPQHALADRRPADVETRCKVGLDEALIRADGPFDYRLSQPLVHFRRQIHRTDGRTLSPIECHLKPLRM